MGVESGSTIPEKGDKGKSQGTSKNSNVHQRWALWVSEVGKGKIEPVNNGNEQSPPEVTTAPEMDIAKSQEVVEGEIGSQDGCWCDQSWWSVQVVQIRDLEDVENDPIDGDNDLIEGKRSVMVAILAPNGSTPVTVLALLSWSAEGVVGRSEDDKEP